MTTHYLEEADRLADRIAVIDHGRLIADGTPGELKDRVGGERLEVRLEDVADLPAAVRALAPMSAESPVPDGTVVRLSVRDHRGAVMEAVRRLGGEGVAADDLLLRRPTLDDVFLALTGHAAEEPDAEQERGG